MKARHVLLYLAVTAAIAGPLLAPGYVFALDHAMGPNSAGYYARYVEQNDDPIQNKGAYAMLLLALSWMMPAWAAQKLILFAPFLLAGLGAHALAARRVRDAAAIFAGLAYMLSPFAYVRGLAGQTGVVWAYALAPWFLLAWTRALDGSRRAFAAAALVAALTGAFQAHGLALLALLVALVAAARLARAPKRWRSEIGRPAALAGILVLMNAAWLVPVALAPETTLDGIGDADRAYFQTTASGLPSVGVAALALQGFWRYGYETPYATPWLLAVPAALLVLSVHGLRTRRDALSTALAAGGVLGFALAVGPASPATSALFDAAWEHVPLARGFRDSQKFLALLALAYADLGAVGAEALATRASGLRVPRAGAVAAALLLALPLATATPLLAGYGSQLGVADYPQEWRAVEEETRGCTGALLVLPWHLYMDQSWLPNDDKRVTNPAKLYFTCPVVASDDVEAAGSASVEREPIDRYVSHWMREATRPDARVHTLGNLLSPVNVQYILVLKESDWRAQSRTLAAQDDLRLVKDDARLQLWENLADTAPAWRTDDVVPVASWADLLPLSETRPLAGLVLAPPDAPPATGARPPSPDGDGRYLLVTPRADAPVHGWTMDGEPPQWQPLGVSSVFDGPDDASLPTRTRAWALHASLWALSAVSLSSMLLGLTWSADTTTALARASGRFKVRAPRDPTRHGTDDEAQGEDRDLAGR